MEHLKHLICRYIDETEDAERYATNAEAHKADNQLSSMFYDLSKQEHEHAERIKREIDRHINSMPAGEERKAWEAVWAYEHEKGMKHIKAAKAMQEMYRA